jgi:flagellin
VQTRSDWADQMISTLRAGAGALTDADMNEEAANMLMLQTRQSLGTTALSLSAQNAQSVLRLF